MFTESAKSACGRQLDGMCLFVSMYLHTVGDTAKTFGTLTDLREEETAAARAELCGTALLKTFYYTVCY